MKLQCSCRGYITGVALGANVLMANKPRMAEINYDLNTFLLSRPALPSTHAVVPRLPQKLVKEILVATQPLVGQSRRHDFRLRQFLSPSRQIQLTTCPITRRRLRKMRIIRFRRDRGSPIPLIPPSAIIINRYFASAHDTLSPNLQNVYC